MKNTFCLARDDYVFVSHHIGDLENLETLRSFTEGIEHFKRLFHHHRMHIGDEGLSKIIKGICRRVKRWEICHFELRVDHFRVTGV